MNLGVTALTVAFLFVDKSLGTYTTVLVPSGSNSTLESYLCGGGLTTNGTSLFLEAGDHPISAGPFCNVRNLEDIAIVGAGRDKTVVRCVEGGRGFRFSSVENLTIAQQTIIGCGLSSDVFSAFDSTFTSPVVLYLESSSLSLQQVTITSYYGIGLFGYAISSSTLSQVQFRNCANSNVQCSGALLYATSPTQTLLLQGCLFENLNHTYSPTVGAGLTLWNWVSSTSALIDGCVFKNISSVRGALVIYLTSSKITNCTFQWLNNGAISAYLSYLIIERSTFSQNTAEEGGAINTNNNYYLSITGSTFDGNVATFWGGALNLFKPVQLTLNSTTTLYISNCVFVNNVAPIGGAVFIFDSFAMSEVIVDNTTLQNNNAPIGAAIYAADFRNPDGSPTFTLILSDLLIKDNYCLTCTEEQEVMGAAIYYTEVSSVLIYSLNGKGSQFIGNNPQGAIQGLSGGLHVFGKVIFENNTADNGGAIGLLSNAHLYFYPNCNAAFYNNTANTYGGAIYIQGDTYVPKSILIECAFHFVGPQENYSIYFEDNRALISGQSIYATPIYNCTIEFPFWTNSSSPYINHPSAYYDHVLNFSSKNDTKKAQILSFPVDILLCGCEIGTECNLTGRYMIFTYPGKTVKFRAVSVDSQNHTSPAVVFTQISPKGQGVMFGAQQGVQWIGKECDALEYQIFGQENSTFNLLLSTFMGDVPTVVQVFLRPCNPGFVLKSDSNGALQCNCSSFLLSSGVHCDTPSGTVTRNGNKWIGVYANGLQNLSAFAYTCPLEYCVPSSVNVLLLEGDQLCKDNRQGLLCGHCKENFSAVFGSAECLPCSNVWLLTVLLYAVLGIALVILLFMINLTVTQGTLYGIIFYANIIQVNTSIFFNQGLLKPLEVIVSLVNLDLGFPLCFYDGMDDAAKAGLQFVFPAYLLTLTITASLLCHYCLRQSAQPNHADTKLNRFSRFVGKRAVRVLATLIYLSYSKLLRTVIQILTYATVHIDGISSFRVWFYDGTIRYLEGRHLVLFIIAMLTSIFFLLPYTLALTLIPIIDRYSDKNVLLNWIHKKANLIKPMNDAYYAPYKGQWRSWLGVRLWLLVILYVPTPFYSSDRPYLLMYVHSVLLTAFVFIQGHIRPFAELPYREGNRIKGLFAEIYNWLDSFYMLNYTILAITTSYLLSNDSDSVGTAVQCLVGLFAAMFFSTIIYHVTVAIKNIFKVPKPRGKSFLILPNETQVAEEALEEVQFKKPNPTEVAMSELREPLMEN